MAKSDVVWLVVGDILLDVKVGEGEGMAWDLFGGWTGRRDEDWIAKED